MRPQQPFAAAVGPVIIAHRGGSLEAPENTVAAVRHAAAVGADWVEVDVALTADEQVVVIHDDTVDRTTDGHGEVAQMTLAQLQALHAGHPRPSESTADALHLAGVAPPDFAGRFANVHVPSLAQVLAVPNVRFMIELKHSARPGSLVQKTLETIYAAHAGDRVALASFDQKLLWEAFDRDASIPRIGIAETEAQMRSLFNLPISAVAVRIDLVDEALKARPVGFPVWAWTAYSVPVAEALRDKGVHGIITDAPGAVVRALRKPPPLVIPLDSSGEK